MAFLCKKGAFCGVRASLQVYHFDRALFTVAGYEVGYLLPGGLAPSGRLHDKVSVGNLRRTDIRVLPRLGQKGHELGQQFAIEGALLL